VKHITSHMGRHTFATLCLRAGVPIESLARMMGHTDIKTTQIYAKVLDSAVEDGFAKLEGLINNKPR
jgi:integrase/recombinase XerD